MTLDQIQLVRSSFAQVQPIAAQASSLFYARLFERDPSLKAMFRGDMAEQGDKLMSMIAAAVQLLDRPNLLAHALTTLGRRHAGYGVQDAHYATVGAALLDTLALGLGEAFTPEVRQAWAAMYRHVSETMQAAAHEAAAA